MMLQMYFVIAEWERDQISAQTKAALQAAKAKCVVLGSAGAKNLRSNIEARQEADNAFTGKLKGIIEDIKSNGLTQREMCVELNSSGIKINKGGTWSLIQLRRVISRL